MPSTNCADPVFRQPTIIAINQTNSAAIGITKLTPRGLSVVVPDSWTAADIYFESSVDGESGWQRLKDEFGSVVKITGIDTTDGDNYVAPPQCWALGAWPYLRLVSSATQTAARTLTVCILG